MRPAEILYWCNIHSRRAETVNACKPVPAGPCIPCRVVDLTGLAELVPDDNPPEWRGTRQGPDAIDLLVSEVARLRGVLEQIMLISDVRYYDEEWPTAYLQDIWTLARQTLYPDQVK